jgi:hypothetical protein
MAIPASATSNHIANACRHVVHAQISGNLMKNLLILALIQLNTICYAQNDLTGLFGKCDGAFSGYMCQQILFKADLTFEFYDLLHLRGWIVSKGTWIRQGDNIYLKSLKPFEIKYLGRSVSDDISIKFTIDEYPAAFATVVSNSNKYIIDTTGIINFPKESLDTISFLYVMTYRGPIVLDKSKLIEAEYIEIIMDIDFDENYYFEDEKWLIKGRKLYHTQTQDGTFDKGKFFLKTKLADLKYRKED